MLTFQWEHQKRIYSLYILLILKLPETQRHRGLRAFDNASSSMRSNQALVGDRAGRDGIQDNQADSSKRHACRLQSHVLQPAAKREAWHRQKHYLLSLRHPRRQTRLPRGNFLASGRCSSGQDTTALGSSVRPAQSRDIYHIYHTQPHRLRTERHARQIRVRLQLNKRLPWGDLRARRLPSVDSTRTTSCSQTHVNQTIEGYGHTLPLNPKPSPTGHLQSSLLSHQAETSALQ